MAENENLIVPNNVSNDDTNEHNKANVPNLRFGENTKYSKYKLKDLVSFGLGLTATPNYVSEGIPFLSSKNISNDYIDFSDIKHISKDEYQKSSKNSKPQYGDILFTRVGSNLGHPVIIETNTPFSIFVSLGFLHIKVPYVLNYYLLSWMNSENFWKQVKSKVGGSSKFNLNICWLEDFSLSIPSLKEQRKIVDLLKYIDGRIKTQSKIINDLESLKIGIWDVYYKNMSEFNSIKLSGILVERKEYCLKDETYPHATLSKDGVSGKTDRYNRDFLVRDNEKEYKVTHLNDICYNPANLKFGVICRNKFGSAIFSPIYVTYEVNKKYNVNFIEQVLTSKSFIQYIRKYEQGTVYERMSVNSDDFLKGLIKVPNIDEQNKITQIINNINLKLQNEKELLELYKKQKAYLLKNMFI